MCGQGDADMTNQADQIRAATERIADQVRRLLTRETTFAELCKFIEEALQATHESGKQEGAHDPE